MKIIALLSFMLSGEILFAQEKPMPVADTGKHYSKPFYSRVFNAPENDQPCMSPAQKQFYNREAIAAKERWHSRLAAAGKPIPGNGNKYDHVLFDWPLKISPDYDMQGKYFYKGQFVDQHQADTAVNLDYTCGSRTYSGHDGSDISLWPFWWRMMDSNYVAAVAAAPGTIIEKRDGYFDRQCAKNSDTSNRIIIEHDDGTTTRYHHLKKNTMTTKDTGDRVEAGEFLAFVGSSGNSTNPHLHFEVHDRDSNIIEPYFINSNCNSFSTETWWKDQPAYWDSKISRVMTHSAPPVHEFCSEAVYAKNNFTPNEVFYVGIAFSENQNNDQAIYTIYKPDGGEFVSTTINMPTQNVARYVVYGYTLPSDNNGTWKILVAYRGKNYLHFFTVGCVPNLTPGGTQTGSNGYIASNAISSTVNHVIDQGDKVLYQAQGQIEFKPGFYAPAGIVLKARIAGCNYAE